MVPTIKLIGTTLGINPTRNLYALRDRCVQLSSCLISFPIPHYNGFLKGAPKANESLIGPCVHTAPSKEDANRFHHVLYSYTTREPYPIRQLGHVSPLRQTTGLNGHDFTYKRTYGYALHYIMHILRQYASPIIHPQT